MTRIQWMMVLGLILSVLAIPVLAHETYADAAEKLATSTLSPAEFFAQESDGVALGAIILLLIVAFIAVKKNFKKQKDKVLTYRIITAIVILATLYVVGATLNLNLASTTGGPVHWHADFEVWNCNDKLDLHDPTDWSNRVGPLLTHEHNDDRMHVEGTIVNAADASFHNFIEFVGGKWTAQGMTYPTNAGNVLLPTSGTCNGRPAALQAFRYRVSNPQQTKQWIYEQQKVPLAELEQSIAGYSNVPPGDCYIVEFSPLKEKTEHICSSYKYAAQRGELHGR